MRSVLPVVFCVSLPLVAQERLLQPADVAARQTAAAVLSFGLDSWRSACDGIGSERLTAALSTACACLPEASAARNAAEGLRRDRVQGAVLASEVAALLEVLTFQPFAEAELPAGVPGFLALDELELRTYPAYRMARTDMKGGGIGAFWPLFQHLQAREIAMTTPVQIDYRTDGERTRESSMAFLYGSPELGPSGRDGKVEVVDVPATTVLTIGSRGYDRPSRVVELRARIDAWLTGHPEWEVAGAMRTMVYNSPSVGSERRYFEVQVPVRHRAPRAKLRESI